MSARLPSLKTNLKTATVAALLGAAALSGCVIAPPQAYYPAEAGVVMTAPPAPMMESYGPAPYLGAVWISGFWGWTGHRHEWQRGRWASPPSPGFRWMPHEWHQGRGGWRQREGRWGR